jgi:hypothetical protein
VTVREWLAVPGACSSAGVRPARATSLRSREESKAFPLEVNIERNSTVQSEASHKDKGGTIGIAVCLIRPCEKQGPGSVLVVRCETDKIDHCGVKEYLPDPGSYLMSKTIETQGHSFIEDEVGGNELSSACLKDIADACMIRIPAIGISEPGTCVNEGMLHPGYRFVL